MKSPLITVLTATYNRADTLPALRASLENQSFRDFEWLVVDDGSSDGTGELLSGWSEDGGLAPRILFQPNGGKHRALNRGIPEARGRWTLIVDSDDALLPDSLAIIVRAVREADSDPRIGGLMGLKVRFDGSLVGDRLPEGLRDADAAALTYAYGLRGDKAEVFKTEVLRAFPFPEFDGENFITECVVWFRIARAGYTLLLVDEPIYACDYRDDGLSAHSLRLRLENPKGTLLFYSEALRLPFPAAKLLREAANLDRFAMHARRFALTLRALKPRARMLAAFAAPIGLAAFLIDCARSARRA